jgi:hypothetical protein
MTRVKTEKELADSLNRGDDTIEIEGDLARKTIRIRATGNVAWLVAFGAIGVAVVGILAAVPTGGGSAAVSGFAAVGAVGILGAGTTSTAIAIAVAAGGVGALTKMRNYTEVSRADGILVLRRKT